MTESRDPRAAGLPASHEQRLRLHRRTVGHGGRRYTLLTLRPSDPWRFGVRVDECTMITSDLAGTRLLGRLLWGLSFQRRPDTVLLLDSPHLVPNPYDGLASPPVAFVPTPLSTVDAAAVRSIRRDRPSRRPSEGTLTWNTRSYARALTADLTWQREMWAGHSGLDREWTEPVPEPRVRVFGDFVTISGDLAALRRWALSMGGLGRFWHADESCAEPDAGLAFDVHAIRHFHRQVSIATRARSEVLGMADAPAEPRLLSERVTARAAAVAARGQGPWDPLRPMPFG
ncbi:hypothetical protein DFP74_4818 [Nocardiopsis sp. Huas11]|uniref:hypothetical protein n=1 Tax=Nocardiopsis sp. Huas11 TaxID=2183912 RepID=UPI000EACCB4E|nr:hypothetical protein [Nocardiopsis sp. Huas11]RKS09089.1 hypothetical protein DFP74_4818 [Nocardiopsis sp. Huas11]